MMHIWLFYVSIVFYVVKIVLGFFANLSSFGITWSMVMLLFVAVLLKRSSVIISMRKDIRICSADIDPNIKL